MKQTWYKGPELTTILEENANLKEQYCLLASQMDQMKVEFSALVEALRSDLEGLRKDTNGQLTDIEKDVDTQISNLEDSIWADHRRLREEQKRQQEYLESHEHPIGWAPSQTEGTPKKPEKLGNASPPCFGVRWKSTDKGCGACSKRIECREAVLLKKATTKAKG